MEPNIQRGILRAAFGIAFLILIAYTIVIYTNSKGVNILKLTSNKPKFCPKCNDKEKPTNARQTVKSSQTSHVPKDPKVHIENVKKKQQIIEKNIKSSQTNNVPKDPKVRIENVKKKQQIIEKNIKSSQTNNAPTDPKSHMDSSNEKKTPHANIVKSTEAINSQNDPKIDMKNENKETSTNAKNIKSTQTNNIPKQPKVDIDNEKKKQKTIEKNVKSSQTNNLGKDKPMTKNTMNTQVPHLKDMTFLKAFDKSAFVIRNVTGDSDKQGELYGYLKPHKHMVVPNIAHFIWFNCHVFQFENLISVLSAHRVMKADRILFHTDCEPNSTWWYQARILIPTLEVVYRERPLTVLGRRLNPKLPENSADVAMIEILMEMGGVHLDCDAFVLAPLEPLRYYDYAVGNEKPTWLNNGIVLATKDSKFLRLYYQLYKSYDGCRGCIPVLLHYQLAKNHSDLVHMEPKSMDQPPSNAMRALFLDKNYNWKNEHFSIHVWIGIYRLYMRSRGGVNFTAENIKKVDTAFGEMCRYIYYGSPDIIE